MLDDGCLLRTTSSDLQTEMTDSKPTDPTNVIYETVAEDQGRDGVDPSLYRQSEITVKENPAYGTV